MDCVVFTFAYFRSSRLFLASYVPFGRFMLS